MGVAIIYVQHLIVLTGENYIIKIDILILYRVYLHHYLQYICLFFMETNRLNSQITLKTPYCIFVECFDTDGNEKHGFDSRPPYQRNIVWGTKQYLKFIESIFMGIVPSPIIIALDNTTNKKICVDGKQRLESIKLFFTNQIPYFKVTDNCIMLYWMKSPKIDKHVQKTLEGIYKISVFENQVIDTQLRCWIENEFQLSIIQYTNITYEQQIDIFNRIQYGMSISRGSYLKSFIQDARLCEHMISTAEKYKGYFGKYVLNAKEEQHIHFMLEILFMLDKDVLSIKTESIEYELLRMTNCSFNELDQKYDPVISTMFDNTMLNGMEVKQKRFLIKCLIYAKNKFQTGNFDKDRMRFVLIKTCDALDKKTIVCKSSVLDDYMESVWLEWLENKNSCVVMSTGTSTGTSTKNRQTPNLVC